MLAQCKTPSRPKTDRGGSTLAEETAAPQSPDTSDTVEVLALLQSGAAHIRQHGLAEARADFERVLARDPHQSQAHLQLARIFQRQGHAAAAEEHYRTALDDPSICGEASLDLGHLLESSRRHDEASALFRQCIATDTSPRRIAQARAALARLAQQSFKVCRLCGRFTTLGDFRKYGSGKAAVCPRCLGERYHSQARGRIWVDVALVIAGSLCLGLSLLFRAIDPTFAIANLVLGVLFSYVMIPLHELAHASMAWLLGGRVFEIRIGAGKALWERNWQGIILSLRPYPTGGSCLSGFPTRRAILARVALVTFAGPALSALILAVFLPLYDPVRSFLTLDPVAGLIYANASILVGNLLPRKRAQGASISESDGRKLSRILIGKLSAEECHVGYYLIQGLDAMKTGDFARVMTISEAGIALYPHNPQLQNLVAIANLETGNVTDAARTFRQVLEALDAPAEKRPALKPEQRVTLRAVLLNNLALALMLDDVMPEFERAQFLELAEAAYCMMPWQPAIEATWGAALTEAGRPKLGLAYLADAADPNETDRDRGNNLAYIAWAQRQLGQAQESAATLDKAHLLAPESTLVRHVVGKLAQLPPAPHPEPAQV